MSASALRAFPLPSRAPTWYIGHMAKSMREFPALLRDIDIVIEARDARVPLSGVNGGLEGVVRRSWGLPGTGFGFGYERRSPSVRGVLQGEGEAGLSGVQHTAGGEGSGREVVGDRKGKGKARETEPAWTLEEKEERLAQVQRQGGRMRERVVVYTKRDLAEERFEEVSFTPHNHRPTSWRDAKLRDVSERRQTVTQSHRLASLRDSED